MRYVVVPEDEDHNACVLGFCIMYLKAAINKRISIFLFILFLFVIYFVTYLLGDLYMIKR